MMNFYFVSKPNGIEYYLVIKIILERVTNLSSGFQINPNFI